ncbi:MAG: ABC transporter permease subunit [Chloroflexota bacterium]|nr:MAG: ABC transporter permease subunit [Chloroflexota bacterium]
MTVSVSTDHIRPPAPPGPLAWLRQNLFNNWYNSLLTVISLAIVAWAATNILRWVFFEADWRPVFLTPLLYLVGQYPRQELWRLGAAVAAASFLTGISWRVWGRAMRFLVIAYAVFLLAGVVWPLEGEGLTLPVRIFLLSNLGLILVGYLAGGLRILRPAYVLVAWVFTLGATLLLLHGFSGSEVLPVVPTTVWGGLLVTMLLAIGGITISFPIGVLLALGRRSSLPVVSLFSTVFIEFVRGVPLIGVLFLASIILPLFLPADVRIDRLLRALIGMTLFSAAYMAENVRGGLASVPLGQVEASKALGLNGAQITLLVVLPQALRAVIPPIVGQFISLFKDTTLASGVAVLEFLSIGRSILQANPEYIGLQAEVYIFIAAVFWIFSYLMSYASQKIEAALGVGER